MLRKGLGRNQFRLVEDKIRDQIVVPGAPSRLSGANHAADSGATAGTYSGVDEDGNTVQVFMYGVSVYGGKDYLAFYDKPATELGLTYIKRLT